MTTDLPTQLAEYGTFETKHYAEILEIGYRATRARMDEIAGFAPPARPAS